MNVRKKISLWRVARYCLIVPLALTVTACFFSAKPIYFDKERAIAEGATAQFHEWHNQQNAQAIHDVLEKEGRDPDEAMRQIKANFEKLGRLSETRLVEQKVLPSPGPGYTSQVKLAYETKFEKGSWTELFVWNIKNSSQALLVDYFLEPMAASAPSNR
jgi:hypothetical protein